jgi:6-phosphogluconolactonase (cycloisomerase 2 family)
MPRSLLIRRAATAAATLLLSSVGAVTIGGASASAEPARHAVYTLSNAAAGNAVLAYRDAGQGALVSIGSFPTGGSGNGSGLGSQGSVVLGDNDHVLAAVNAGSNSVSLFRVENGGRLQLLDTVSSGGTMPISATIDDHRLYVLNAGGAGSIAGFRIEGHHLRPLAHGVQSLSAGAAGPAEVAFTPDGTHLVVTEKGSNTIDTFSVDKHGNAGPAVSQPSVGTTPFGFAFDHAGHAIVSEASGGAAGAAAVSSYVITDAGAQNVSNVADGQTAACWIAISPDGHHAYTTNAGSGNVSTYDIAGDGTLTLASAVASTISGHPSDEAVGGQRLYVLENNGTRITAASIGAGGALGASSDVVTGLPASAVGLAATQA